jgi:hypothetical protein
VQSNHDDVARLAHPIVQNQDVRRQALKEPRPIRAPLGQAAINRRRNQCVSEAFLVQSTVAEENDMGFGRGMLLWLIGIPLPLILLLALFMHH